MRPQGLLLPQPSAHRPPPHPPLRPQRPHRPPHRPRGQPSALASPRSPTACPPRLQLRPNVIGGSSVGKSSDRRSDSHGCTTNGPLKLSSRPPTASQTVSCAKPPLLPPRTSSHKLIMRTHTPTRTHMLMHPRTIQCLSSHLCLLPGHRYLLPLQLLPLLPLPTPPSNSVAEQVPPRCFSPSLVDPARRLRRTAYTSHV